MSRKKGEEGVTEVTVVDVTEGEIPRRRSNYRRENNTAETKRSQTFKAIQRKHTREGNRTTHDSISNESGGREMIFVCFPRADGVKLVVLTTSWPDPVFGSRNGSGLLGPLATSLALTASRMRVSTSAEVKGEDSLVGARQVIRLGGRSSSSFDFFPRSLRPRKGVVLRWKRCDSQAPSQGQCAAAWPTWQP